MSQCLLFFFLLIYSLTSWADQLIIEPNMGRAPLVNKIGHAEHSIDLVMYGFTDKTLLDAIVQQKKRGLKVNIILESTPYKFVEENVKAITALKQHHINLQGKIPPYRLIHQKTLILDDRQAIVMTFNFTNASFKNERNFALVVDNPKLVHAIDQVFNADWQHKPNATHVTDLIYSPDDSRTKLLNLITHAKHTINIYAQNVNDYKIVGALAKAARKGINVKILTSSSNKDKQAEYLNRTGAEVKQSKNYYIHAKVMIIDDQLAVVGSINFTRASLDSNRELSIVTRDPKVIAQLTDTFHFDWQNTQTFNMPDKPLLDKRSLHKIMHVVEKYLLQ